MAKGRNFMSEKFAVLKNSYFGEILTIYFEKRVPRYAAALSYYLTLSLFPLLIVINAILSRLGIGREQLYEAASGILPGEIVSLAGTYLEYIGGHEPRVILIAGVGVMLMSSSSAYRTVTNIMSDIQGPSRFGGILLLPFSFLMSVVFIAVIYVSAVIILAGEWLLGLIDGFVMHVPLVGCWPWIRYVLLFALMYLTILMIYVLTAPGSKPYISRAPGAFLSALLLVVISAFMSWFVEGSVKYKLVYGSLASIIILMVWLYACGCVIVLGNIYNIVRFGRKADRVQKNKPNM